jgi:hypothetical protein
VQVWISAGTCDFNGSQENSSGDKEAPEVDTWEVREVMAYGNDCVLARNHNSR